MPINKLSRNDKLIIDGQEIEPFDEKLSISWINSNAYTSASIKFNNESFNILVLKDDVERLKGVFNANN